MRLNIVIPVQPPDLGKSRLAGVLRADERAALSESMFQHVLRIAVACAGDGVQVISRSGHFLALAAAAGAAPIRELGIGLNAAISQAAAQCDPAIPFAALSADLPLLAIEDLDEAIGALSAADVIVATDRTGTGTNMLLQRRPGMIEPGFGPESLIRHRDRARSGSLRFRVVERRGLALDLDLPADLPMLEGFQGQEPGARLPGCAPEPHNSTNSSNKGTTSVCELGRLPIGG